MNNWTKSYARQVMAWKMFTKLFITWEGTVKLAVKCLVNFGFGINSSKA